MSTDKRKPGNGSKVQTTSKINYKQKSILDSFTVKTTPRSATSNLPLQNVVEVNGLSTTTPLRDGDSTTFLQSNQGTQNNISDTTPTLPIGTPAPVVDLTSHSDVEIEEVAGMKEKSRSPSITILDVDMIPDISTRTGTNPTEKPQAQVAEEGRTWDQPIIIPSSPIKSTISKAAPVHPFFASKPKQKGLPDRPLTKKLKTPSTAQDPPYPNNESQHVKGPQTTFPKHEEPLLKRSSKPTDIVPELNVDYAFLKRSGVLADEPTNTWIYQTPNTPNEPSNLDIPQEHTLNHPAIARLVNDGPNSLPSSSRPWTDKWRPSCAKEVLGNENSALYLRNWLRALELQLENSNNTEPSATVNPGNKDAKAKSKTSIAGSKRVRVVRAVDKRRKRSRLDSDEEDDSWIVDTDESEEEVNYEEIDEFDDILLPEVPDSQPSNSQPSSTQGTPSLPPQDVEQDLGQLHNTILLSGPSGSGKTACVYACTEELGWDVFEVYPGVGRRNGANVDNLVGEVGKNHLVLQSRRNGDIMKSFLSKTKKTEAEEDLPSGYHIASYSPRKKNTVTHELEPRAPDNASKPIRQSLILLEEVDILFKEDVNFWTTVIQIIKECKRPVICTCNDVSLVPLADLPLQTVIQFESCPADIGLSYLEALCSVEGYSVGRDVLSQLSAHPFQSDAGSQPLGRSDRLDLRRTLNNLQMRCTTAPDSELGQGRVGIQASSKVDCNPEEILPEAHPSEEQSEPRLSMKKSEFLSYLDSNLIGDVSNHLTETELASYLPTGDDEIGHTVLYDIYAADKLQFGHDDRHEDMICSAVELSTRLFDVDVRESDRSGKRVEEMSKKRRYEQLTVLKEICPAASWTRGLWMEYLPYVRQIVASEDRQEAAAMAKGREGGRRTRNSARREYIRTVELSGEGRRMATESGFNIVEGA